MSILSFRRLAIGPRLALGFGLLMVLLAAFVAVSINRLASLNSQTTQLSQVDWVKARLASTALDHARGSIARVFEAVGTEDQTKVQEGRARLAVNLAQVTDTLNKLEPLLNRPEGQALIRDAKAARDDYVRLCGQVLQQLDAGHRADAVRLAYGSTYAALHALADRLRKMVEFQERTFAETAVLSEQEYVSGSRILIVGAVLAALLSGGMAFGITRSITRPLGAAVQVARRVAEGDLGSEIEDRAPDEPGQLMAALAAMNSELASVVREVRAGAEAVTTASAEIAQGNLDLSSRTEQQASALEETASSMEELTSTVKQNADNARQANQMAASAAQVAQQGGAAVAEVVQTMDAISGASRRIVDIIAVIDGIAFQTNILALNAAVEAARAGEQGRGFAVVASEVRNLAQRSAAAAKEIKGLIDASVNQVDTGVRLVGAAGATMEQIVGGIQRVADIMNEITAASREQEAGIGEINDAVSSMDSVTQQNAALVEQAAAAAQSLTEQAESLVRRVSIFQLPHAAAAPAPGRGAPVPAAARTAPPRLGLVPAVRPVAVANGDWTSF